MGGKMKYIRYEDKEGVSRVDIFDRVIIHKTRAHHLFDELGLIKVVSAGTFKWSDKDLDEPDVTPGSYSLNIRGSDCDAAADATAIKHALMFM
jgi:hypothetical protein